MEEILMKCSLFENMKPDEITELLRCLRVEKKKYSKNDMVLQQETKFEASGYCWKGNCRFLRKISGATG